jgi:hypothetical protein
MKMSISEFSTIFRKANVYFSVDGLKLLLKILGFDVTGGLCCSFIELLLGVKNLIKGTPLHHIENNNYASKC